MAILTLYPQNPRQSGSSSGLLDPTVPTASTSTTGWTVGTTFATRYSRQSFGVEVPAANFTTTQQPSGAPITTNGHLAEDCWRTSAVTSGIISADTFFSALSVIAVTAGGSQDGRAHFRLWYSPNADGTGATELTAGGTTGMIGTIVTNLSTSVAQNSSASTALSRSTLTDVYLFWQIGWDITGQASAANRDVLIRLGTGSELSISGWSATGGVASGAAPGTGYFSEYYRQIAGDVF